MVLVTCCLALTLALLFARGQGQVGAPAHTMQAWAAHEGQRAQQVKSLQGLGHFGDTAQCGWRSSQHVTQLLGRGPGAGSEPGGGRTERNTKTGTTQGGQAGEGAYGGGSPWLP